jgi:hypothetical protein
MDPITTIGAAASISQLLALCVKPAKAAKDIWEAYSDAPNELRQLAGKLETLTLKVLMHQIEAAGGHLATENTDYLLPPNHRTLIMAALADQATQLEHLKSLQRDHHAVGPRLRWALLDKSKSNRIIKAVTEAKHDLEHVLSHRTNVSSRPIPAKLQIVFERPGHGYVPVITV